MNILTGPGTHDRYKTRILILFTNIYLSVLISGSEDPLLEVSSWYTGGCNSTDSSTLTSPSKNSQPGIHDRNKT